eukprot:gene41070-50104_t
MSPIKRLSLNVGHGGVVLPAAFAKQSGSVILAHGLGDSAEGLEDLAMMWRERMPHLKFILPTAGQRAVAINMNQRMNAWYNISALDDRAHDPCEGLEESADYISSLVRSELALGVPRSRIVLAGFSQGGALSLFTGLQRQQKELGGAEEPVDEPLAGILVLSGYLPKAQAFSLHEAFRGVPVLLCHGAADPVVRPDWAERTRQGLLQQGLRSCELKSYAGVGHSVSPDILRDAAAFLAACLPPSPQHTLP